MKRIVYQTLWIFLFLNQTTTSGYAADYSFKPDEIMPLSQIKPGMKGYGKTVFRGTTIEKFDVEVVGISKNFYPQCDVILIRLNHPITDAAKIIHGMSGSPIYINDKVIGALAYGFSPFPVDPIAGVTPIEYMLGIENRHQKSAAAQKTDKSGAPQKMSVFDNFFERLSEEYAKGNVDVDLNAMFPPNEHATLSPLQMPLSWSGINPTFISRYQNIFQNLGFTPVMGASGGGDLSPKKDEPILLEPGSVVAGTLVAGDFNMSGTGTVTYRNGNKIVGFGHPFFGRGLSKVPMSQGEILTVIADQTYSFKMDNLSAIIGSITQDDTHGIYGEIGEIVPMIKTAVNFNVNGKPDRSFQYKVLQDDNLTPFMFFWTFLYSFLTHGSLGGERTLDIQAKMQLKNYPPVVFEDRFSGRSTEFYSAFMLVQGMGLIMKNPFIVAELDSVEININVVDKNTAAEITHIWYSQDSVNPGDKLDVTLFIKPYRGETFVKKVTVPIPEHLEDQNAVLVQVGSGNNIEMFNRAVSPSRFSPENMEQLVEQINKRRNNKNLYVRLLWQDEGAMVEGEELPALPPSMRRVLRSWQVQGSYRGVYDQELSEIKIPVDYIISGSQNIPFRITKNNTLQ